MGCQSAVQVFLLVQKQLQVLEQEVVLFLHYHFLKIYLVISFNKNIRGYFWEHLLEVEVLYII